MVITGASSGIGRGAALAFAARGADVVLAARSASSLADVARECVGRGGRAVAVPTDVTDEAAVHDLAARAVAEFGRIDVWVSCAAVWSYGRFEDTPAAVFRQVVETTLFGQVHSARAVLPHFRSQGGGVLVNVSSLYGRLASPYVAPYAASKWALNGFSAVLRQELRDAPHIHVCTVLPGAVDTPVYRHAANYVGREIRPLPPVTSPERVVAAILRAAEGKDTEITVGRAHHLGSWAYRLAPGLYNRLVGSIVDVGALRNRDVAPHDGTVFAPAPETNAVDDGWRAHDHRVVAKAVASTAGVVGAATAAVHATRRGRRSQGHARSSSRARRIAARMSRTA